jgi:hypothetical protein
MLAASTDVAEAIGSGLTVSILFNSIIDGAFVKD